MKKDIMIRVWLAYIMICLFALAIVGQVVKIKFIEGEYWKTKADSLSLKVFTIQPVRGNIYSSDGRLLATSTPIYELRIDTKTDGFNKETFNAKIDSLSQGLSKILGDRTAQEYKALLRQARKDGDQYFLLKKNVGYKQYRAIQQLPVFNAGRYKGGLIVIAGSKRDLIYNGLAKRTIGYKNPTVQGVGIEGSFDSLLTGVSGQRIMQRLSGGVWKPIGDDNEIEPEDGMDVITTIDQNIQDVAEQALYAQLSEHGATSGCAVLMEVKTGEVKAIANLKRRSDGTYEETYNFAIGQETEPGSTFKLASLIAAMDDGYVDLDDSINIQGGVAVYSGIPIKDSHHGNQNMISVQQAFEQSSNVAISKIITKYYAKNPQKFVDDICRMHLNQKLGLQVTGEGQPFIKNTKRDDWWNTTLPFMSIGYETQLSPLQILSFYNAIANDGKMVKPLLVKEVRQKGRVIKDYPTEVLVDSICSKETLTKAHKMLEGVVLNGTAKNLKFDSYTVAGKTGTAKMSNGKNGYITNDSVRYQASFCGYFPADAPLYSCIVVIYDLSPKFYYGNVVSGPVFREIADKVYATRIEMHKEIETDSLINQKMPLPKNGSAHEIKKSLAYLEMKNNVPETDWIQFSKTNNIVQAKELKSKQNTVPDVTGMGLKDAVYLLETNGLSVKAVGKGAVKKQSINAGSPANKGQQITIELG